LLHFAHRSFSLLIDLSSSLIGKELNPVGGCDASLPNRRPLPVRQGYEKRPSEKAGTWPAEPDLEHTIEDETL
jgi:hypothetical protein